MRPISGLLVLCLVGVAPAALAEPYLAVRQGMKCMVCHVNPTGGGMRNAFGNSYAQNTLAAKKVAIEGPDVWSEFNLLTLGGDLRTAAAYTHVPPSDDRSTFETQEFRLYLAAYVIPGKLLVYLDQQMTPGSANREAYARLGLGDGRFYVKAGQIYLPYGLRLEDDSAFIREVPGINMTTPDNGVEVGYEHEAWSVQLAASNGGAATDSDEGKQGTLRAEYVQPLWRFGGSVSYNHLPDGGRQMQNLFAGLKTGPLAWLAELDYVVDDTFVTGERGLIAGLIEANWEYRQGFNVKLTVEGFEPDDTLDEDEQARYSLVWEHTPIQFLQVRLGARIYEGIPQNELQNRRHGFLELHGFF